MMHLKRLSVILTTLTSIWNARTAICVVILLMAPNCPTGKINEAYQMLKIVFCHDGQPINDFKALAFADSIINEYRRHYIVDNRDMTIRFSTECVLDAFVLRTMEDETLARHIEFYYRPPNIDQDLFMEFNEYRGLKIPEGINEIGVHATMIKKIVRLGCDHIINNTERKI
jgi:hypothetical protein